jgi:hypothetical protein
MAVGTVAFRFLPVGSVVGDVEGTAVVGTVRDLLTVLVAEIEAREEGLEPPVDCVKDADTDTVGVTDGDSDAPGLTDTDSVIVFDDVRDLVGVFVQDLDGDE